MKILNIIKLVGIIVFIVKFINIYKKIGEENNNNKKDNKKNTNDEFDKEIKNYKVCSPKICIIF